MRFRIDLEYDGSEYFGWQKQKSTNKTIQSVFESSLKIILGSDIPVTAAGRTDTGVHALNMTAHFDYPEKIKKNSFLYSINRILPSDIVLKNIRKVKNDFHARYSAKRREYIYKITTKDIAIGSKYFYKLKYKIDFDILNDFIDFIKRVRCFKSLCKNAADKHGFESIIYDIDYKCSKNKGELIFRITAKRFLHSMVRAIIGLAIDVSRGRLESKVVKKAILTKEKINIYYLPGNALFLKKIYY